MAISGDYGQLFCEAVDTIVKKRLENISFDTTKVCTIIDDSKADSGVYQVRSHDGVAEFNAYTDDTTLKNKDVVYVQIPSGDMNEQKFIIAKKTDDTNIPLSYKHPFASFVNITGNLISNTEGTKAGLIANEAKSEKKTWAEEKIIWAYNPDNPTEELDEISDYGTDLSKYSRLGIQAQFRSWLGDMDVISGSYGLRLRVEAMKEDIADIESLPEDERIQFYDYIKATVYNENEIYYTKSTDDKYEKIKDNLTAESFSTGDYYIANPKSVYYDFDLDSSKMVGDAYNFNSYYQQEQVFDIRDIYKIRKMELQFYQRKDFYNKYNNLIEVLQDPNLFVKDISICLGYDLSEFDDDKAIIYSFDSPKYMTTADPAELNHKQLYLRWIHKDKDGKVYVVPEDNELDYKIVWYKYRLGSYSHTPYSGADWAPMSVQYSDERIQLMTTEGHQYDDSDAMQGNEGPFKYNILDNEWKEYNQSAEPGLYRQPGENKTWLIPDITLAEESVKVVISYLEETGNENSRKYLVSDIVTFTNREEVVSKPTVDAVTALTIHCEDESNGNYLIYNKGNKLIDEGQGQEKVFTAYFKGAPLESAEYIEWIIPKNNSMVKIETNYLGVEYPSGITDKKEFADYPFNNIGKVTKWKTDENGEKVKDENGKYIPLEYDEFYHIFRFGDSTQKYRISYANSQRYKILPNYYPECTNNIIQCRIVKDKITYTATKELVFGQSGSSGTDHTLNIRFDEPNIQAIEVGRTDKVTYKIKAELQKYGSTELVDLYNMDTDTYSLTWKWYDKKLGKGIKSLIQGTDKRIVINAAGEREEQEKEVPYVQILELSETELDTVNMKELHILEATLTWRDHQTLTAYFPIPFKRYIEPNTDKGEKEEYAYIDGPKFIQYSTDGSPPFYDKVEYKLYKNYYKYYTEEEQKQKQVSDEWSNASTLDITKNENITWDVLKSVEEPADKTSLYPTLKENVLQILPFYIQDAPLFGVQAKKGTGEVVWTQPVMVYMDRYPNGAVNRWDGEGLELDEENGTIIGAAFAAGRKESDGSFSGVMLGDWDTGSNGDVVNAIGEHTGVYGFNEGEMSYAFMDTGQAFIGKSSEGRIYFDGDKSQIYSAGFGKENGFGMMIDLGGDSEPYIKMRGGNKYTPYIDISGGKSSIYLEASQNGSRIYLDNGDNNFIDINSGADGGYNDCPFKVGDKFRVDWNGDLYANNAKLKDAHLSGIIYANLGGMIGGWYIGKETLEGGGGKYVVVTDEETGELKIETVPNKEAAIILNSTEGSIAGGILRSTDARPIFLDGTLSVSLEQTSYNPDYSNNYGYMGAIGSNMGTIFDSNIGVGMWASNSVVKATTANVGMAFSSDCIYINEDGLHVHTGDTSAAAAARQSGIYARFA